jgi:hypothetical protein
MTSFFDLARKAQPNWLRNAGLLCLPGDLPYNVLIWFGFSADGAEWKRATGIRQGEVPAR